MTNRHYIHEKRGNSFVIYNCFVILLVIIFSWPLFGENLRSLATQFVGSSTSGSGSLSVLMMELASGSSVELIPKVNNMDTTNDTVEFNITESFVYPNPVRLQDDWALHYKLSKADDLETRVYDMFGRQVYKKHCSSGNDACKQGVNTIDGTDEMGNLSSGVYFFVLIHDNEVKAKGKFAAVP